MSARLRFLRRWIQLRIERRRLADWAWTRQTVVLAQLSSESAFSGSVAAVLKSLPESGQRPFLAALPQAALSNPEGPLGVLAHMDLAWTYAFTSSQEAHMCRTLPSFCVMS